MIDLSTNYLGFKLKNPLVASSSPMCARIDSLKKMEENGVSAVVLHSLFEEQVIYEQKQLNTYLLEGTEHFAEALTYLPDFGNYKFSTSDYLEHVHKAKEVLSVPVIASLNGVTTGGWIRYAREIEQAGADALELNIFDLPTDPKTSADDVEQRYVSLIEEVAGSIGIPLAVKMNPYFSSIPNIISRFTTAGANAMVLFNRFYQPDINLRIFELHPDLKLSTSEELRIRLRWAGLLYGNTGAEIAISGGIHTVDDIIKCIAVGANVTMMTSAILKNGAGYFSQMEKGLGEWLERNEYPSLNSIMGIMSRLSADKPDVFVRANYLQMLGGFSLP